MQVIHPKSAYQGIPAENVFVVLDDMGTQVGMGYIIYQYQEHLYPDCPVNIYFTMEGQTSGRYLLFGALVARARQLRDNHPGVHARFYTGIAPEDAASREFYLHSGMSCEDTENQVRLPMSGHDGRLPIGYMLEATPLTSSEQITGLSKRMQDNDVSYMDPTYLVQLMRQPHFHAVGMFMGKELVGEAVVSGAGDACTLEAIYIAPAFRRRGLGKVLASSCLNTMLREGVLSCTTRIATRSLPQRGLIHAMGGADLGATMVFPSLYL